MSGERGSVEYYLERALLARLEAERCTTKELRDELLRIAALFEALAEKKKQQYRDPA